jgi:hypothetical protein
MLNKNKVLRTLENLPETFSIEEIDNRSTCFVTKN